MKKFARMSSLVVCLMIFLGACSLTDDAVDTTALPAPDNSHRAAFAASGKLYDQRAADIAIREGKIGSTTNLATAAVALFFDSSGNLLTKSRIKTLSGFCDSATETEARTFLQNAGVTLYYTDAATYKFTMRNLASQGKLSLSNYASLSASPTTTTVGTQKVAVLNPYAQKITSTAGQSEEGVLEPTQSLDCLNRCSRTCSRLRIIPVVLACYLLCAALC